MTVADPGLRSLLALRSRFFALDIPEYFNELRQSWTMTSNPIDLLSDQPNEAEWLAFLDAVMTDFGCVTGTLHRLDPADNLLKLVVCRGVPSQLLPVIASIPIGKGIAGAAAQRMEPVELCNLQTDTSGVAKPGAKLTNVQGSLAVPVLKEGVLRGTLGVGKSVPHDFTAEEKSRLLSFASGVAERV